MISTPMSLADTVGVFLILGALWTTFFALRCLFWFQVPNKPPGARYWHIFRSKLWAATHRRQKLCGYHFSLYMRPGQSAYLDSANCEKCNAESNEVTQ